MAVRNKETGKYHAECFIRATGKLLISTGSTKAEATEDLQKKKITYYSLPLVETENEIRSPGYRYSKDDKGNQQSECRKDWKVKTKARPEIAEMIKASKSKNNT